MTRYNIYHKVMKSDELILNSRNKSPTLIEDTGCVLAWFKFVVTVQHHFTVHSSMVWFSSVNENLNRTVCLECKMGSIGFWLILLVRTIHTKMFIIDDRLIIIISELRLHRQCGIFLHGRTYLHHYETWAILKIFSLNIPGAQ